MFTAIISLALASLVISIMSIFSPGIAYVFSYGPIAFLIAIYVLEYFKKEKFNYIVAILTSIGAIIITCFTFNGVTSILALAAILLVYVGVIKAKG